MVKLYIHLAILGNTYYLLSLFEPIVNLFTNWKDNFVPSCLKSIKVLDVPREDEIFLWKRRFIERVAAHYLHKPKVVLYCY